MFKTARDLIDISTIFNLKFHTNGGGGRGGGAKRELRCFKREIVDNFSCKVFNKVWHVPCP